MFTGYREFDAYARSLRRTVWARQFEQAAKSMSGAAYDLNIGELFAGEPAPVVPVVDEPKVAEPRVVR